MPSKYSTIPFTPNQLNQIHAHIITTQKPNLLNSLLKTLTLSNNNPQNALLLYNQMIQNPTSHDHFTFTYAIKASSLLHSFHKGQEIHARVIKSGLDTDVFIGNSLIRLYSDAGDVLSACNIFINVAFRNIVSWTTMISGLVKNGCEKEAIEVFSSIDVKPNPMTLVSVLSACSQLKELKLGKSVHGYNIRSFNGDNIFVDNAILNLYAVCGCVFSAGKLFENMCERDVVSWTTMINGYARKGCFDEAIRVFNEMVHGEIEPNEATLVTVLSVCVSQGSLSLGSWVHSYIVGRDEFLVDGNVGNALMNMYSKCGEMGKAFDVFSVLRSKDMVSWSILIGGMGFNGYGKQALQVFSLMLIHGIEPDEVTFVGLLSACCHARLVTEGLMLFKAMKDVYRVAPEMKHFACVVDMYGRAGLFDEAEEFIREMPVEPDEFVWSAMVNACKMHGDNETVDRIIGKLLVGTRSSSVGIHRLVSNMYASMNRWNDAENVEEMIRLLGERKTPGCSWIEGE